MDNAVAGNQGSLFCKLEPAAAVVGRLSACFAQDQIPGRDVPRMQQLFKIAVDSPGRDIAQVERGGADPAYIEAVFENLFYKREVAVGLLLVRGAGAELDETLPDVPAAYAQAPRVIAISAPALLRRKDFLGERIVYDSENDVAVYIVRQRYGTQICSRKSSSWFRRSGRVSSSRRAGRLRPLRKKTRFGDTAQPSRVLKKPADGQVHVRQKSASPFSRMFSSLWAAMISLVCSTRPSARV